MSRIQKYYKERVKALKTYIDKVVGEMKTVQQGLRENEKLKKELQDYKQIQDKYAGQIKQLLVAF